MEEEIFGNTVNEPGAAYYLDNKQMTSIYINPFRDKFFKKIFASETSKEVLRSFLNVILQELPEKRDVKTVVYGKNEYPGEIDSEGGSAFDVICTDTNGATFLVEVQQARQRYFKERSVFYAGRLMSDQAPKGVSKWKYDLKDVYVICLLTGFELPDCDPDSYFHNIGLCDKKTGKLFYKKLDFIYLVLDKFHKQKDQLTTGLDEWLYALKYTAEMNEQPDFFKTPKLTEFFHLAKYSNLTIEERKMYRTQQQMEWDNQNVFDYAIEEALEKGFKGLALEMKQDGINIDRIVKYTKLSREQIEAL